MTMSTIDSDRETASGLATAGNKLLNDLIIEVLTPEQIAFVHNRHIAKGESILVRHKGAGKGRVQGGMTASRRAFMEALRRNEGKYDLFGFGPGGELTKKNGDTFDPSPAPALVETVEVAPSTPKVNGNGKKLSARMAQVLGRASSIKQEAPTPVPPPVPSPAEPTVDLSDVTDILFDGAQESQSEAAQYTARTFTACELADSLLVAHAASKGDALWANPVKVFDLKNLCKDIKIDSHLVVAVCSSTALVEPSQPHSKDNPKVKHDFRADDIPVTHSHPAMMEQTNHQHIIRSKSTGRGGHEYYVKILRYVEGMIFKGYFMVDGIENAELVPPTYWIAHKGKIVSISESIYLRRLNALAASKPKS